MLVSRKKDEYKEQKIRWLQSPNIEFDFILMRKSGGIRRDSIIKSEIFYENIKDKFFIEFVIDDRPQVIRMWSDIVLLVFQVYDKEF